MRLNYNQFLAVVYGDLFDWPLTEREARVWAINFKGNEIKEKRYDLPASKAEIKERKMEQRGRREKVSKKKLLVAIEITEILKKIPTVQGIFLTGSVAVGNAKEEADIDLMIVTKPGTLWLTRFWTFGLLKSLRLLRSLKDHKNKICPNIFLDTDHLEIVEKNLYTAHEILQTKCLFDRGGVEKLWLGKNKWVESYLPFASKIRRIETETHRKERGFQRISDLILRVLVPLEMFAFSLQYFYMKGKMTNERVGWGYAFFHPRQLGKIVEEKFWRRLVKYTH